MTDTAAPQPPSLPTLEQEIQTTLQQALTHHQAGQWQEAGSLYRAILQIQQNHPDANHNLGVLLVQAQQPAQGLPYFEAALEANPESEQYWLSFIDALLLCGKTDVARQRLALGRQHGLQGEEVEALAARLAAVRQVENQPETVRQHDVDEASILPAASRGGKKQPKPAKPGKKANASRGKEPDMREMTSLVALFDQGNYTEGERLARDLTKRFPQHGFGWKLLGAALQLQGCHEEALLPLQKAAAMMPWDAEAHSNLGNTLWKMGQLDGAMTSYRRALKINPDFDKAHSNLGNLLRDMGRLDEAVASYRRALEIKPDNAMALNNLGSSLQNLGRLDEAVESYRRALEIDPGLGLALNNLAIVLGEQGKNGMALNTICRSLKANETQEARSIFAACARRMELKLVGNDIRDLLVRALVEPWGRPSYLAHACIYLIKHGTGIRKCLERVAAAWPQRLSPQDLFAGDDLATVAADPLLCALLDSTPACDIELERLLTMVRHAMLETAAGAEASESDGAILNFYGALARQCFINEYVFACTDDESSRAQALRDALSAALEAGTPVPPLWPIAVAAYFPLHALPFADRLTGRQWPEAVSAVLVQQVGEPAQERQYRANMPRLTGIEDGVSLLVQGQYEENPYPRWVKAAPISQPSTIDQFLRRAFPFADFRLSGKGGDTEILVAGCGTGQQPIDLAQQFPGALVMAVDLSLTSLCYAKRKTQELGLTSIEYAQADILELGTMGRSFDMIASSGVLHHLADPLAGWRVLLSLLRPGGFMKLGFYSEVARRGIVRARSFIAGQGYGSSAEDIRRCRQDIMNLDASSDFGIAIKSGDFFSTSACRDLLFHVQEHRMTLPGIDAFLRENGLRFLGFEHAEASAGQAYRRRFPDDRAATDLGNWEVFENENPDTFFGMYQFYVQKAEAAQQV
ncbi:MAG: tetratricopeptide repeat protein [Gallionella sp.]|nr:tetratricopeptide repeat protein [Gallionella sp.]